MLTATEISIALETSLGEGRSMAIVSLMSRDGQQTLDTPRLLVEEEGGYLSGTLGDKMLDELAARYAVAVINDERKEIVVTQGDELLAFSSSEIDENATLTRIGNIRLLIEISRPQPEMIICGGGHVGQAMAKVARLLDFNIVVIDDRVEFTSREKFPDSSVRLITDDFVAALRSLKITRASHVVIVTRGHRHDEICLKEVIARPARYIGMIGSRRRTTTIREHLRREGVAAEDLRRVHAPIGLDIGAMTPEEIAVSILAEIILVRRGGTGIPKGMEGPMARAR
jgi:xanthine dehydrogenase accessory factor